MWKPLIVALSSAIGITGCTAAAGETVDTSPYISSTDGVLSCDQSYVDDVVNEFANDFNAGSATLVEDHVAGEPDFMWFGTPERPFPGEGRKREGLAAHLADLHDNGVRFELKSTEFTGVVDGLANFTFDLDRVDVRNQRQSAPGKGAILCDEPKIAVWLFFDLEAMQASST